MTSNGLALDSVFISGGCPALGWRTRRASGRGRKPNTDYCLVDERGVRVGVIPSARRRPSLGANGPTVFLRRDWLAGV